MGINLAPLTNSGCQQAEDVAEDERLQGAQIILSSPYTRALQTAAIISRKINVPIKVEMGLHEWVPDLHYLNQYDEQTEISNDFIEHEGFWPNGEVKRWEPIDMFSKRIMNSMNKYSNYEKIVVICHAVVIYHLKGIDTVPFCCISEIDFTSEFQPQGWFYKK